LKHNECFRSVSLGFGHSDEEVEDIYEQMKKLIDEEKGYEPCCYG